MDNDQLKEKAMEAIKELFCDTSVSVKEAIENMKYLQEYIELNIANLHDELKGSDTSKGNGDPGNILFKSIRSGDTVTLKAAIMLGADVNSSQNGFSALLTAAMLGNNYSIVEILLDKGARINAVDGEGWSALHWASNEGHIESVKLLLYWGADINAIDKNGCNSLLYAIANNHVDIAESLITGGININSQFNSGGTALMIAVENGNIDGVRLLIQNGASVDIKDDRGNTASYFLQHIKDTRVKLQISSLL